MAQKDDRLYAKFTLDFPESAKIKPLSDKAYRILTEMVFWSRRAMSDGFIPEGMFRTFGNSRARNELLQNDPERPSVQKVEGGYRLHDFEKHQSTRAEIEADRISAQERGRKGGKAKAANQQNASKPLATSSDLLGEKASQTYPETQTETSTTDVVEKQARKRATRLTSSWQPDPDLRAWAATETPHVNPVAETQRFIDYWIAQPGQKGVKVDWPATWRNWMRRNEDDYTAKGTKRQTPEERLRATLALATDIDQKGIEA